MMKSMVLLLLLLSTGVWMAAISCDVNDRPQGDRKDGLPESRGLQFRHHFIEQPLEGDAWGQTSLADVDLDGDLDFVLGRLDFRPGQRKGHKRKAVVS